MAKNLTILVSGCNKAAIEQLAARVRETSASWSTVTLKHIANGNPDPLYGLSTMPDVLILHVGAGWPDQLGALLRRDAESRPATLVVGPAGETDAMRMAMQAGARDYVPEPVQEGDLLAALDRIRAETQRTGAKGARWTLLINTKGGCGASFLACNLAEMMAGVSHQKVALIDLDVQFGTLANYLDIRPRHSLVDALDAVGELDRVALEGYMEKYSEKLHLLSAAGERVVLPENLPVPSLDALFDLISGQYDQVVVDAPRILNHFTATAIERADSILLVMQQSVAGLEETLRLAGILRSELGVMPDRMKVIVNRYQKNMAVDAAHIKTAIGELDTVIVPNDFRQVMQSVDSGIPIYRHARGSSVTKSLLKLQHTLSGQPPAERRGLLGRSIAQLLGA